MQIINLYKYQRADGGSTVSPMKPDLPYSDMYRIIASEGMLVTHNGVDAYPAIDVDSADGWYEIKSGDAKNE